MPNHILFYSCWLFMTFANHQTISMKPIYEYKYFWIDCNTTKHSSLFMFIVSPRFHVELGPEAHQQLCFAAVKLPPQLAQKLTLSFFCVSIAMLRILSLAICSGIWAAEDVPNSLQKETWGFIGIFFGVTCHGAPIGYCPFPVIEYKIR